MDRGKPRKGSYLPTLLILTAAVGVIAFAGWRLTRTEGSPVIALTGVPDSWTHKELAEHFDRKGLKYKMITTNRGAFFGPAVYFAADGSPASAGEKEADQAYQDKSADVIYCQIRKTAQEAKDEVGTMGSGAFASGRFVFAGPAKSLDRLKAAVP